MLARPKIFRVATESSFRRRAESQARRAVAPIIHFCVAEATAKWANGASGSHCVGTGLRPVQAGHASTRRRPDSGDLGNRPLPCVLRRFRF